MRCCAATWQQPTWKQSSAPDPAGGDAALSEKKRRLAGAVCEWSSNYWHVIFTGLIWLPELIFSVYTVPAADAGIVTVVVAPPVTLEPEGDGVNAALNVPVPPVTTNCRLFGVAQLMVAEPGVTTSDGGGGAAVPTTLLTVGGVCTVCPAESTIANVS